LIAVAPPAPAGFVRHREDARAGLAGGGLRAGCAGFVRRSLPGRSFAFVVSRVPFSWRCLMSRGGSVSVVSVRGKRPGDPSVVYVGRACAGWRPSALGNPFHVGRGRSRAQAIAAYRSWLWESVVDPAMRSGQSSPAWRALLALVKRVVAGEHVVLGCWCHPLPCHADVIAACVRWLVKQGVAQ